MVIISFVEFKVGIVAVVINALALVRPVEIFIVAVLIFVVEKLGAINVFVEIFVTCKFGTDIVLDTFKLPKIFTFPSAQIAYKFVIVSFVPAVGLSIYRVIAFVVVTGFVAESVCVAKLLNAIFVTVVFAKEVVSLKVHD